MANKKDYATSTVLTAPSPADSGTSLVVQSGHGARFPAASFYVTVHPPSEFPTIDNAEKLLVTAKSTDTFTITRGEGDTSPLSIEAGWRISNAVFLDDIPDTFDDLTDGTTNKAYTATEQTKLAGIETAADVTDATNVNAAGATMNSDTTLAGNGYFLDEDTMTSNSDTKVASQQSIKAYVDAAITATKAALYPVGSIYSNASSSTNPGTLLGFGTWAAFGQGRMLIGAGTGTRAQTFATTDINTTTDLITIPSTNDFLQSGQAVVLTTTGSAPGGLTAGATYYAVRGSSTVLGLATSVANAILGTIINITSTGSGTHTLTQTLTARTAGVDGGEETHALTVAQLAAHSHTQTSHRHSNGNHGTSGGGYGHVDSGTAVSSGTFYTDYQQPAIQDAGGSSPHNIMNPYVVVYLWQRTA